jgi:ribosome-binding protein aMBF1 (putative translation factor)
VPPRVTLAWNRCALCGRHAPTWRCRVGGRYVDVCLFCAYTLRLKCEGLTLAVSPSPTRTSLEPDEALLKKLEARRPTSQARRAARRYRGRR